MTVVVSPKNNRVHPFWKDANSNGWQVHWKYVGKFGELDHVDGLPLRVLGYQSTPTRPPLDAIMDGRVYLQPEDSKDESQNRSNQSAVVASCMRHGYRFTSQLHKELGLP